MALSSPYPSITWTPRNLADTLSRVVQEHRTAVGGRLKQLRQSRGMSQEDAAYAVGVTLKTWGDWERGKRDPYDANWKKIGEAFAVDPAEVRGTPPAPLGLGAREDQVEGGFKEFRTHVADLTDRLERIEENVTARAEHDQLVERLLKEQTHLLERIRVLLAKNEQIMQPDRIAQAYRDAAQRDVQ